MHGIHFVCRGAIALDIGRHRHIVVIGMAGHIGGERVGGNLRGRRHRDANAGKAEGAQAPKYLAAVQSFSYTGHR